MPENEIIEKLERVRRLLDSGLDESKALLIYELLGGPPFPRGVLEHGKLYSETLPKAMEAPFTLEQRYLHFLWDAFDKLGLSLLIQFSIPFRRMLAERLFKSCGHAFIAEENVRFNFGQYLSVGEGVFFNRGVTLDTKGGLSIGNYVVLSEDVRVYTHSYSEASHIERIYSPVIIGGYAKVYAGATIMPGVVVGAESIVGAGAMVTEDVPPKTVVSGNPAKVIRERQTEGRFGEDLDHIWLF